MGRNTLSIFAVIILSTIALTFYLLSALYPPLPIPTTTTSSGITLSSLYALQTRIFDQTLALRPIVNSTLLSPTIRGRVDITRTFTGIELNTEYLFSLFAQLSRTRSFTLLGIPTSYTVTHFAGWIPPSTSPSPSNSSTPSSSAIASSAILMNFTSPTHFWSGDDANDDEANDTFTLEIHAWTLFDAAGRVQQYDATFRHWPAFIASTLSRVARRPRFAGNVSAVVAHATAELAATICAEHEAHCTTDISTTGEDEGHDGGSGSGGSNNETNSNRNGSRRNNRQYSSEEECVRFLTREVRFGASHEMGLDTLLCRMVHSPMVALRPEVHCPHVGPTGGDMCTDALDYGERIDQGFWMEPWMLEELDVVERGGG
ncbi:Secreted protein [Lasiodiplodia theobromae]|uniref:Uncharacterized protein n=1 Tax=Lasiodiplodia theobromae TaxID=45133 RepID=A0A5N5DFK3_9PEZI|nr:Secreted protein [Lasiodiplodia theobromae]KAB2576609.1 hypothetical protein DBV05_g4669 [Lasiodiplodia theobromae]KAF4534002.1 Secreted protein [Lasiodiplodia theobromae]